MLNICIQELYGIVTPLSVQQFLRTFRISSWIKTDQLDVTCFFVSLFHAQHVSDVNTSILRSLRLICWVISWVVLLWYDECWSYVVVWLGVVWYPYAELSTASALFNAQLVSNVSTSILRSLRLIFWVIS